MMSVLNQGEFKCSNMTFEETKAVLEMYDEDDILLCFTNNDIKHIIFNYLGIERKEYTYKHIRNMRVGQGPSSLNYMSLPPRASRSSRRTTAWRPRKSRTSMSIASM